MIVFDNSIEYRSLSAIDEVIYNAVALALVAAVYYWLAWPLASLIQSLIVLAVITGVLIWLIPRHLASEDFGSANRVTLLRADLVALLAGLAGHASTLAAAGWLVSIISFVILLLDGVDGWLARRNGLQSAFGARFDMEIDAFFILILALLVFQSGKAGVWVLLSGILRYAFVGAGVLLPWLQQPLPPKRRRQTVCVIQTLALIACLSPLVAPRLGSIVAALALILLVVSFSIDTVWLLRHPKGESE